MFRFIYCANQLVGRMVNWAENLLKGIGCMEIGLAWGPPLFIFKRNSYLYCTNKATDKANLAHGNPMISRNGAHQGTFENPSQPKIVTLSDDTSDDIIISKTLRLLVHHRYLETLRMIRD